MKLKRCENGHFYDQDKFAACPHCAAIEEGIDDENQTSDEKTVSLYQESPQNLTERKFRHKWMKTIL